MLNELIQIIHHNLIIMNGFRKVILEQKFISNIRF